MFFSCYSLSDLALRNCYLTADLTVKVGDYGIGPYRYKVHFLLTGHIFDCIYTNINQIHCIFKNSKLIISIKIISTIWRYLGERKHRTSLIACQDETFIIFDVDRIKNKIFFFLAHIGVISDPSLKPFLALI